MDTFITKEDSKKLKGIAIIMMVAMHIFKISWVDNPESILDISVRGGYLSHVLAESFHASTAIFAFCSGYIWEKSIANKSKVNRILKLYISFWTTIVIVSIPFHFIDSYILNGTLFQQDGLKWVCGFLALSSDINAFCWYISFFPMAVITFQIMDSFVKKFHSWKLETVLTIFIFVGIRAALGYIGIENYLGSMWESYLWHYNSTMPRVLIGAIVARYELYTSWSHNRILSKTSTALAIMMAILTVKYTLLFIFSIGSEVDSLWIIFEIYAWNVLIHNLSEHSFLGKVLLLFGKYSLYIWLIHSSLMLSSIQPITYFLRIPILILAFAMSVSLGIAWIVRKADMGIKRLIKI